MPIIATVADCHIGNHRRFGNVPVAGINDRGRATLHGLRDAVTLAATRGASVFLIAGDLFDDDHPLPQVLSEVQDVLAAGRDAGLDVVILVGNHDQKSADPGDHALGPLREWATIVDKPTVLSRGGAQLLCLPYDARPAGEWFRSTVDGFCETAPVDLVAMHLGIMDDKTPPWLRDARDAIPSALVLAALEAHGVPFGVAGNWHNHASWAGEGATLVQCGALTPTGWDNEGVDGYGGLIFFDTSKQEVSAAEIPGPRFVRARNITELKKAEKKAKDRKLSLFVRIVADPADLAEMSGELEAAKGRGLVVAGEVEADAKMVSAAARSAAHSATKAETLDEALAGWVGQMTLDEDLSRDEVRGLCAGWLGGGR